MHMLKLLSLQDDSDDEERFRNVLHPSKSTHTQYSVQEVIKHSFGLRFLARRVGKSAMQMSWTSFTCSECTWTSPPSIYRIHPFWDGYPHKFTFSAQLFALCAMMALELRAVSNSLDKRNISADGSSVNQVSCKITEKIHVVLNKLWRTKNFILTCKFKFINNEI